MDNLLANKNQENNRLKEADPKVAIHIEQHIDFLVKEIEEVEDLIANHIKVHKDLEDKSKLLGSIPSIGEKTIGLILAFPAIENFDSAKQITTFVGLNPKPRQSDSYVRGS